MTLVNRLSHGQRDVFESSGGGSRLCPQRLALTNARRVLAGMKKDLDARTTAILSGPVRNSPRVERRVRVERMDTALSALSPLAILERGYALVFDASGKLLKDAARVKAGDEISARLAKGTLSATAKKARG